jgi:NAD(P)-binding Rossmann-like domain
MNQIDTDYLIVGAGAVGMGFADSLLSSSDATMVIVDRRDRPGGHWNDAYPFVRLHQPSSFYGVNSRELGEGAKDSVGLNQGLYELAGGAEILSHYDQVMRQRLLPSGRVRYLPMNEMVSDDECRSLTTGKRHRISFKKRVDATYSETSVPSTHAPQYSVASGIRCVPLNELPRIIEPQDNYVVVGSGKTGMDAILWLLDHHVDPASIHWIMPRDAWLLDRAKLQPNQEFFLTTFGSIARQLESVIAAQNLSDLFHRLSASGDLLRIDENITPTMYCCATVTQRELQQLRRIKNIVRLGRVQSIDSTRIVLTEGSLPLPAQALIVDCSASAIPRRSAIPIWNGKHITLQMVRRCQPAFSAAFIAHVEASFADDAEKNFLCAPVPPPNRDIDWLIMAVTDMTNSRKWGQHDSLKTWLANSRLNSFYSTIQSLKPTDTEQIAVVQRFQQAGKPAFDKLQQLLAQRT